MQKAFPGHRRIHVSQTLSLGTLFLLLLLAACQAMPPPADTAVVAGPVDARITFPANVPRFVVDPEASEIRMLVYRAGPLARFGHNHTISGRVRGEIRAGAGATESGFRLQIPVESLIVDAAAARAEEGEEFAAEVSEQARQATRDNLLGKDVLDSANQPLIEVHSIALSGPRWNPTVHAQATLRRTTRDLRFPAAVVQQGDLLTVIARFQIRQSDFNLAPFAALGGGLQVRDLIDIRLRLVARRAD
jgi:hypothetical protein